MSVPTSASDERDDEPSSRVRKAVPPAEHDDPLLGTVVEGRYRIEKVLGVGGVGVVYEARHMRLQHMVALKLLRGGFVDSPLVRRRFEREAKVLSDLSHPNIVGLTDYGIHEGAPYLVMEKLEGRGLEVRIGEHPPSPAEAIRIMKDILRGLAFAHDRGVLHRDLKPANVFLQRLADGEEHPKLLDFGLAKLYDPDADEEEGEPTLTRAGSILGTPAYMAPEQASGSNVGTAADVYSAGVVLFELLAGRPPFSADRRTELLRQHMIDDVPDPSFFRAGLVTTPELRALLLCCLAKEPSARYRDGRELLAALEELPNIAATVEETRQSDATRPVVRRTLASRRPMEKKSRPVWVLPLTAACLGAAIIVAAWFVSRGDTAPPQNTPSQTAPEPETTRPAMDFSGAEEVAAEEEGPSEADFLDGADPFARPLPAALAELGRRLEESETLDRNAHRETRVYQRLNPDDPRPTLLLAHDLANRASWPQAVERYELAYSRWPESMGDPRMLDDLVSAAVQGEARATALMVRVFDDDAREAVRVRLAESEHRPTRAVLRRLLDEISGEAP